MSTAATILTHLKEAAAAVKSEGAERNAVARVLARYGVNKLPTLEIGRTPSGQTIRVFRWKAAIEGHDVLLITGPSIIGEVRIEKHDDVAWRKAPEGAYIQLEESELKAKSKAMLQRVTGRVEAIVTVGTSTPKRAPPPSQATLPRSPPAPHAPHARTVDELGAWVYPPKIADDGLARAWESVTGGNRVVSDWEITGFDHDDVYAIFHEVGDATPYMDVGTTEIKIAQEWLTAILPVKWHEWIAQNADAWVERINEEIALVINADIPNAIADNLEDPADLVQALDAARMDDDEEAFRAVADAVRDLPRRITAAKAATAKALAHEYAGVDAAHVARVVNNYAYSEPEELEDAFNEARLHFDARDIPPFGGHEESPGLGLTGLFGPARTKTPRKKARAKVSTVDPATMTPSALNAEYATLDKKSSALNDALIAAGRGHDLPDDLYVAARTGDPLSTDYVTLQTRRHALQSEAEYRGGPTARFPLARKFKRRQVAVEPTVEPEWYIGGAGGRWSTQLQGSPLTPSTSFAVAIERFRAIGGNPDRDLPLSALPVFDGDVGKWTTADVVMAGFELAPERRKALEVAAPSTPSTPSAPSTPVPEEYMARFTDSLKALLSGE